MSKVQSLQEPFLNMLRKEQVPVSIFLVNGIKLQGQIESFDQFVVLLRNSVSQIIYKHAISTVLPSRDVRLPRLDTTCPDTAGPNTTEPGTVEPGTVEPNTAGPNTAEPGTVEPNTAGPNTAEPGTGTVEPDTAEKEAGDH